ncbi:TIGR02391 family protein [Kribbella sp. VKM Ac-2566]|uniref:TIGR02391 family protein n=1 Tax=Kribbella sp. VKM Ac-2566 TaxID=2512218 RepID=UPI0014170B1C|nr:TIGR02391 family protein [Kribbella sp. VKM Ac-2566]
MYSHLPNALAELIANAYDADATKVRVFLRDDDDGRAVVVEDNGHGMGLGDLQDKYLRIGRNRRAEDDGRSESGRRVVAGKKGLGKLALFGIGETILLTTKRHGESAELQVALSWSDIKHATGTEYHPALSSRAASVETHGTTVELTKLHRRTPVNARELAQSLGRLFGYLDEDFEIEVIDAAGLKRPVDRDSRLNSIDTDVEWRIPEDLPVDLRAEVPNDKIRGRIVAAAKPVPAEQRGVALYAHGRLANEPEFYGVSESSYAFSYLTGYLDVDYIDDGAADVIATDRRSISWDSDLTADLNTYLQRLLRWASHERRAARKKATEERIESDHGVDLNRWVGSIRSEEREAVGRAASVLTSPDSALDDGDRNVLFESLRTIAPDYADLHWRHLHPAIKRVSERYYESGLFHAALSEALKRFVNEIRTATGLGGREASAIVNEAFKVKDADEVPQIDVAGRYADVGFDIKTLRNMREGQWKLSHGVVTAFRNPVAHEEELLLIETEAMTYQDCLDALSILSHLYRHLERALESSAASDSSA